MQFDNLVAQIRDKQSNSRKSPFVIAISGFGGSGKSSLANKLKDLLLETEVISLDDFIVDRLSKRSEDWEGFDRKRFQKQILEPVSKGLPLTWDEYNWKENKIIGQKSIPKLGKYLILEGCSLFHPELIKDYDFKIWIDYPLEAATARGAARDRSWGLDHDELWNNLWMPNERDFFNKYRPDKLADFIFC